MSIQIVQCNCCGLRVVLKADGSCPSCRATSFTALSDDDRCREWVAGSPGGRLEDKSELPFYALGSTDLRAPAGGQESSSLDDRGFSGNAPYASSLGVTVLLMLAGGFLVNDGLSALRVDGKEVTLGGLLLGVSLIALKVSLSQSNGTWMKQTIALAASGLLFIGIATAAAYQMTLIVGIDYVQISNEVTRRTVVEIEGGQTVLCFPGEQRLVELSDARGGRGRYYLVPAKAMRNAYWYETSRNATDPSTRHTLAVPAKYLPND